MSGINRDAYFRFDGLYWGADFFNSFLEMAGNSLNKLSQLISSLFFCGCENNVKTDCKDDVPLNANRVVKSLTVAASESENDGSPKSTPSKMDIVPNLISSNRDILSEEPKEIRRRELVVVPLKEDITKLKTQLCAVKSEYSSSVQSYQLDFKQFKDRGNYHSYPIDTLSSKIDTLRTQIDSKEHVFKKLYPNEYQAFLVGESDEEFFPIDLG